MRRPSLASGLYQELAQYVAAKRKAVEMHADFGQSYLEALKAVNARSKREM
ncbi:MAG TPA: hypothetical protein VHK27_01570 [Gammaproteobacteria bacterium]|jgi:hypothetical protein|nr:hypothetical protein [Gammaproteobacteria bacterium]